MRYLFLLFLSFNVFAQVPCNDTGGEIRKIPLSFTVPFERTSNQPMVLADYHEHFGVSVYVNNLQYDFQLFPVTGEAMSIQLWTQCDLNYIYATLTDIDGRESVPSAEVVIDFTPPKIGIIECVSPTTTR